VIKKNTYNLPPTLELVYPNGGENFAAGSGVEIKWGTIWTEVAGVKLEYDAGSGWQAIAEVAAGELLPTSEQTGQTWRYTTTAPPASWNTIAFDDAGWQQGPGGFGTQKQNAVIGTAWTTPDIWLRRSFNPGNLTQEQINNLAFRLHHDEDVEIYINGVPAASAQGYMSAYGTLPFTQEAKDAVLTGENNLLAVHCHQTTGGQYIDVGIISGKTGSMMWTVPEITSDQVKVRVSTLDGSLSDESDGYFALTPVRPAKPAGSLQRLFITGKLGNYVISLHSQNKPELLQIMDVTGKPVRGFKLRSNRVYWDGLDGNGKKVAKGVYVIKMTGNGVKAQSLIYVAY